MIGASTFNSLTPSLLASTQRKYKDKNMDSLDSYCNAWENITNDSEIKSLPAQDVYWT